MGAVVAIDDVIIPVTLASLKDRAGEAEGALPRARLGGGLVLGEGELANVVVPGAEKMDGLDAGGGADGERKLSSGHFADFFRNKEATSKSVPVYANRKLSPKIEVQGTIEIEQVELMF